MAVTSSPGTVSPEAVVYERGISIEPVADWSWRMLSFLRIAAGLAFMLHGSQKLLGFPPTDQPSPELMSLIGLAGILELGGGLILVLGLFTRPVAFLLATEMAVAYFMVHLPQSVFPMLNQGEPAFLYFLIFLYLAFAGGGPWSLDWAMRGEDETELVVR